MNKKEGVKDIIKTLECKSCHTKVYLPISQLHEYDLQCNGKLIIKRKV